MVNQTWPHRWERRTEWPLAVGAVAFLVVYSAQVLARAHGAKEHDVDVASSVVWGICTVITVGYGDQYPNQAATAAHVDDLRKQLQALSEALRNRVTPAEQPSSPR